MGAALCKGQNIVAEFWTPAQVSFHSPERQPQLWCKRDKRGTGAAVSQQLTMIMAEPVDH